MQYQHWMNEARAHWQEFQPKRFEALTKAGELDKALQQAASETAQEIDALIGQGVPAPEAWAQVREMYLFPPPEPGAVPEAEPSEGFLTAQAQHKMMQDFNDL